MGQANVNLHQLGGCKLFVCQGFIQMIYSHECIRRKLKSWMYIFGKNYYHMCIEKVIKL